MEPCNEPPQHIDDACRRGERRHDSDDHERRDVGDDDRPPGLCVVDSPYQPIQPSQAEDDATELPNEEGIQRIQPAAEQRGRCVRHESCRANRRLSEEVSL